MNITFNTKNGYCPQVIVQDVKFFIQDKRVRNYYEYALFSRPILVKSFKLDTFEECNDYIKENKFWRAFGQENTYENKTHFMSIENFKDKSKVKTIRISENAYQESEWYEEYLRCLEYSKKHVSNWIEKNKPCQITFEELLK